MVTTRGSSKAQALKISSSLHTSTKKQPPKPTPSNNNDAKSYSNHLVPQAHQEESHTEAAPKQTSTRKRKRPGEGARKTRNNVGPQRYVQTPNDDTESEQPHSRPTFEASSLEAFVSHIKRNRRCGACWASLEDRIDVRVLIESKCPPQSIEKLASPAIHPLLVLSAAHCPSNHCKEVTCLGCGATFTLYPGQIDQHPVYGCDKGWYVALWLQLVYSSFARAPPPANSEEASSKVKKSSAQSHKSKTSKASSHSSTPAGTGYASGNPIEDLSDFTLSQSLAERTERQNDKRDEQILTLVASLLRQKPETSFAGPVAEDDPPSQKVRKSSRKSSPRVDNQNFLHDSLLLPTLFHWSGVLRVITHLFHDDSLEEAFSRHGLYSAALDVVEALLDNASTSKLITEKTFDAAKSCATQPSTTYTLFPELQTPFPVSQPFEFDGASISESMDNILMACDSLANAASSMPKVYKDKRSREMLDFARRFQDLGHCLGKIPSKQSNISQELLPQTMPSSERFELLEESAIMARYTRAKDTSFKGTGSTSNQRMRVLHRELHMLRTSLPIGIYVKMASNRPDIIKALIIGPEGTPYEGGLFEFDILCTKDYPATPPKVDCATAAREEARPFSLNPNLYNNGYVCLSVINTWHGSRHEQWLPGKSTLLQVLVSIQSMVLGTATPADNEPGGLGTPHEEFNRGVQAGTIRAALLPWLQASELKTGVWKEVIDAYFRANAGQILTTVRKWSRGNKRITEFHPHKYPYIPMPIPEDFVPPPLPAAPDTANTAAQAVSHPQQGQSDGTTSSSTPMPPTASNSLPGTFDITWPPEAELTASIVPPPMPLGAGSNADLGVFAQSRSGAAKPMKVKTTNLLEELEKAMKEYT